MHESSAPAEPQDTSYRRIFDIALPMILAYISVPLMGFVDMAVVGHLDDPKYIGGVAIGAVFFSTTYFVFFFLRWSTTGLTAQLFGAPASEQRSRSIGETLVRAMGLGLAISLVVLAVQRPLLSLVLDFMKADGGVRQQALAYSGNRVMGAPAVLLAFALTGWFIGATEAKAVLAMTLVSNAVNAGLAVFFVYALGMKANGSGLAAAVADWSSLGLGLIMFLRRHSEYLRGLSVRSAADPAKLRSLILSNAQIAVKLVSTIAVMYGLMVESARFGPLVLAANALILQLFYFGSYVLDGFANACEALTGRAYGGGDIPSLRKTIFRCAVSALAVGMFFTTVYILAGPEILGLMSSLPDVLATANGYLVWGALLPPGMALAVMFEGVFVGTMRTAALRDCSLFGAFIFFAMLWPAVHLWGNHGLWFAFLSYFLARQSLAYTVYIRGISPQRWLKPA